MGKKSFQKGFTLLEVMLVLVLMGLATSVVIPSVSVGNSSVQLEKQARQLGLQLDMAARLALMDGRDIGLQFVPEGYRFIVWDIDKWTPLEQERYLQPNELKEGIELDFYPGASHWAAAIAHEEQGQQRLTERDFAVSSKEERYEPDIFFWSGGEVTPVDISFCPDRGNLPCWWVMMEETGNIDVNRDGSA